MNISYYKEESVSYRNICSPDYTLQHYTPFDELNFLPYQD